MEEEQKNASENEIPQKETDNKISTEENLKTTQKEENVDNNTKVEEVEEIEEEPKKDPKKEVDPKTNEEKKEEFLEKKEEFLLNKKKEEETPQTKTSKGFAIKGIPAYLLVIFLILGLVGGFALSILLTPQTPVILTPPEIPSGEIKPVDVQLIYSNDCSFCLRHNTILDLFTNERIEFTVQDFEASSEEGQKKINSYGVKILPTALIPQDQLIPFPEIKLAMDDSFNVSKGFYVIPESNLDSSKIYSRMYLEPVYPNDCKNPDSNSMVIIFDDPYNEISIRTFPILHNLLTDFDEHVNVEFEYIQANTSTLFPDANMLARDVTAEYLVCAGLHDKLISTQENILSIYCDIEDLENNFDIIGFCNAGDHFGTPLTIEELIDARPEFESNDRENDFNTCLEFAKQRNLDTLIRAPKLGITRTGTAVVDCKYHVPLRAIDDAICASHPDIELCKTDE